jgi:hypothetical protein
LIPFFSHDTGRYHEEKMMSGILENKMPMPAGTSFSKNAPWEFTLCKHTSKYTKKNLGGFNISALIHVTQ